MKEVTVVADENSIDLAWQLIVSLSRDLESQQCHAFTKMTTRDQLADAAYMYASMCEEYYGATDTFEVDAIREEARLKKEAEQKRFRSKFNRFMHRNKGEAHEFQPIQIRP